MEPTLLVSIGLIVIYLMILTIVLLQVRNHYNRLIKVGGKHSLTEILNTVLDKLKDNKEDIKGLKSQIEKLFTDGKSHVQKVGIIRFNPFSDTGGDQSFVMAILDGTDSGIVLTSLHSRNSTRWYAKNVKEGKGRDFELTNEERKAIKLALQSK